MKHLLTLFAATLAMSSYAQVYIFEEYFEGGVLSPGWVWMGNDPVLSAGQTGDCVSKESRDLCTIPLSEVWQIPLMFHPLPLDTTMLHSVSASMRVDNPLGVNVIANAELGWYDPITGAYLVTLGSCLSISETWEDVVGLTEYLYDSMPGAQFGVILTANYSATGAHVYFDNVLVSAWDISTNVPSTERGIVPVVFPNPAHDRLKIQLSHPYSGNVDLFDATGRPVEHAAIVDPTLDVSGLSPGVYTLVINDGPTVRYARFVKE